MISLFAWVFLLCCGLWFMQNDVTYNATGAGYLKYVRCSSSTEPSRHWGLLVEVADIRILHCTPIRFTALSPLSKLPQRDGEKLSFHCATPPVIDTGHYAHEEIHDTVQCPAKCNSQRWGRYRPSSRRALILTKSKTSGYKSTPRPSTESVPSSKQHTHPCAYPPGDTSKNPKSWATQSQSSTISRTLQNQLHQVPAETPIIRTSWICLLSRGRLI